MRDLRANISQVELILFLNKCDILARKLARGVPMKRYISTYGDRVNDMPTASKCTVFPQERVLVYTHKHHMHTDLRKHFQEIARKHSPEPRHVHAFLTTAIVCRLSFECYGANFFFPSVVVRTLALWPTYLAQSAGESSTRTYKARSLYPDLDLRRQPTSSSLLP